MAAPLRTVRALATVGAREKHCQCANQAFSHEPSPARARHWYQCVTTSPGTVQSSSEAVSVLTVLFPYGHAWIPASDWF
jgi:hypothetical protein